MSARVYCLHLREAILCHVRQWLSRRQEFGLQFWTGPTREWLPCKVVANSCFLKRSFLRWLVRQGVSNCCREPYRLPRAALCYFGVAPKTAILLTFGKNDTSRDSDPNPDRWSGGSLVCAFTLLPVQIDFLSLEAHEHGSRCHAAVEK